MDNYTVNLIIIAASLGLLVTTELFYREPLFNASIAVIIDLQKTVTPLSVEFFKIISDVGAFGTTLILLLGSYLMFSRERAFYYICLFATQMYLQSITKMIYHSPRPYMVNDTVQVFGCATEFGHPSGHSLITMCASITMLLDRIASLI